MRWSLFGRSVTSQTPRRGGLKRSLAVELLESRVLLSNSNAPSYGHVDEIVSVEAALPNTTSFVKSFGGSGWDTGETIIQTSDGGYAVLGSTKSFGAEGYDFWMLRLDAKGGVVWQKTFGGFDNEIGRCVIQTSDGGFALAGFVGSFGAGQADGWLLRLDPDGNIIWENAYGGYLQDDAFAIVENDDGGLTIAGGTRSAGAGSSDFWVFRVDASGEPLWSKTYGTADYDFAYDIVTTSDGGYAITGGVHCFAQCDFWLLRLDADGSVVFDSTYGGDAREWGNAITATRDGGFVVVAETSSFGSSSDAWVVKTDAAGAVIWEKAFGGALSDEAFGITESPDGTLVVTGSAYDPAASFVSPWAMKLDQDGHVLWRKSLQTPGAWNHVTSPVATSDGGYVVTGLTNGAIRPRDGDLLVAKLDCDGDAFACKAFADSSTTVADTSTTVTSLMVSGVDVTLSITPSLAKSTNTDAVEQLICPLSPEQLLAELYEDVVELELPHGIQRSLLAKLEAASERLAEGNFGAASNNLEAFIHHVEAQRGKKIPGEAADQLIIDAQVVIDVILTISAD